MHAGEHERRAVLVVIAELAAGPAAALSATTTTALRVELFVDWRGRVAHHAAVRLQRFRGQRPLVAHGIHGEAERLVALEERDGLEGQVGRVVRLLAEHRELLGQLGRVEQQALGAAGGRRHEEHESVAVPILPVVIHRVRLPEEAGLHGLRIGDGAKRGGAEAIGECPVALVGATFVGLGCLGAKLCLRGARAGGATGGQQHERAGPSSETAHLVNHVLLPPEGENGGATRRAANERFTLRSRSPLSPQPETRGWRALGLGRRPG